MTVTLSLTPVKAPFPQYVALTFNYAKKRYVNSGLFLMRDIFILHLWPCEQLAAR